MEKHVIYQWSLNTKLFGPLNNVTWIMMLLGLQESCNCKSWKRYEIILMRMKGFIKENTKSLYDWMITRNEFHVGDKVLFYHSRLKLFLGKLRSRWIGPFFISNVYPYGAVEITSLETNKVFKINGHQLKTFYEGWTTELTASMELVEPIYEAWAYDVSSQWYKTKACTRSQPCTQKKKKNRFAFFFLYLLFFAFYFTFVILLYSFSFISTLRTILCLKCGGIEIILIFFVVSRIMVYFVVFVFLKKV